MIKAWLADGMNEYLDEELNRGMMDVGRVDVLVISMRTEKWMEGYIYIWMDGWMKSKWKN